MAPRSALLLALVALPAAAALPVAVPPGTFEERWSDAYDGGSTDQASDATFTSDGSIAIAGRTYIDSNVGTVTLVAKWNADGTRAWALVDRTASYGRVLAAFPDGGLVAAGSYGKGIDVVALSADGEERWRDTRATAWYTQVHDLWTDAQGNAYLAFLDGDTIVRKTAADGTLRWERALPTNLPVALAPLGADLLVAASNGFRVHLWRLGTDGTLLAQRDFDSSVHVAGAAALGDLVVLAGRPRSLAVDGQLHVVWEVPVDAGAVAASAGRATLLGNALTTVDGAGTLCAVSPRPVVRNAGYGIVETALRVARVNRELPEEHLTAVARGPDGAIAVAGLRWDAEGDGGAFDAFVAVGSDVLGGCGGG